MTKMVSGLMGGPNRKTAAKQAMQEQKREREQKTAMVRQQQESANTAQATAEQLGRASRTPRGRRLLIGEAGSTLG